MENIIILIFDKPYRRGAGNRHQVPVIDAIIRIITWHLMLYIKNILNYILF